MTIWQLQCYLVHTHMLHEDMTSDYGKIGQDMIYVNFFSLTEWLIFGILYRIMLCIAC